MPVDVETFYRRYAPMVFRRCVSMLRDEEQAADAMQDVFEQVLKRRESLNDGAPSSLLYTMATNVCLNRIKRNKRTQTAPGGDLLETIADEEDHVALTLARDAIDFLLGRENERAGRVSTRTLAVLHYVDGYSYEETAELTGLSVSGIRKRLRLLAERSQAFREESI